MKILVTGGAGYLGSVLVPELLKQKHEVTVIDNFMYHQESLLDCCYDKNLNIIRGDVRNEELIKEHLKDKDFVIPLAAIVGMYACDKDPYATHMVNVEAIKLILKRRKNQKIIYPNTNSGYGVGQKDIFCTEETPLNPISYYGKTKCMSEKLILDAGNCIVLRLATVFGISPRMRLDLLVNDFVSRAINDRYIALSEAHFKRNYIHIRDVARAFIHCIDNFGRMKDEIYNVGLSDVNLNKKELCMEIQKQIPDFVFTNICSPRFVDPDKRNYIVSNDKIEETGFKPMYSLQDGIAELIKGCQIIRRNNYTNF